MIDKLLDDKEFFPVCPKERHNIKYTRTIDFGNQEFLDDEMIANACVTVATSNRKKGSLSHLLYNTSAKDFASDLRTRLGEGSFGGSFGVCLSGGWDRVPQSRTLIDELVINLRDHGFIVELSPEHADVMGNFGRQARLFKDRLEVIRTKNEDGRKQTITLTFPRVD